jgi:peptidoglycan/LPS O-acetylase OafA/YrhL
MTSAPTSAPAPASLGYEPALDGIRAVAALVVLFFHAQVPGFANGAIGVDIFFTLSGFLITGILLSSIRRTGRVDYRTFYLRRALRLLPAYLAVVLAAVLADLVIDSGGTLKGAVFSFFYVANWAVGGLGAGLGALGHTWSLSIEEQFYIVWPALLVLLVRAVRGQGAALAWAIGGLIAASYLLAAGLLAADVSAQLVYNATPTRAVELLAGALLACVLAGRPQLPATLLRSGTGWAGLATLLLVSAYEGVGLTSDILVVWPLVAASTCCVIAAVYRADGSLARALGSTALVEVGKRSYGLYLWHFPIFTSIDATLGLDTWPPRLLGLALTAVVVPLSYRYVERPFLERKDRIGRRSQGSVSAATPARPEPASATG